MRNDSPFHRLNAQSVQTRRDFLWHAGGGLGGVALAAMLSRDALGVFDASTTPPRSPSRPRPSASSNSSCRARPAISISLTSSPTSSNTTVNQVNSASRSRPFRTASALGSSRCGTSSRTATAEKCSVKPSPNSVRMLMTSPSSTMSPVSRASIRKPLCCSRRVSCFRDFLALAAGSATASVRSTRTFPPSSCCPTTAECLRTV